MPQTKQTMRLDYPNHAEEIASLNLILAGIQRGGTQPELKDTIDHILARLDHLQQGNFATVRLYDQREGVR
jgi:hypothetical protein